MTSLLSDMFGVSKPIIAMLHVPALPGRPRHDRRAGMRPIIDAVARDLAALQDGGVEGPLFCNEADLPYLVALFTNITPEFASSVGHRTVAQRARSAAYLGADALLVSGGRVR
jgi:predicted TIM-barrel enzyme